MGPRILAIVLLLLASPLLLVLFVLVRATSRGRFLYSQERPGLHGELIRVYKIRTMVPGSDRDRSLGLGVHTRHPNVTPVGRVLRALKLDELPQLFNVARGEMSFVGPRPIAPVLSEQLSREIEDFTDRYRVRPGLTSLGQVTVLESQTGSSAIKDWKRRFDLERHYFAHRSRTYDAVILCLTVLYMIRKMSRWLIR